MKRFLAVLITSIMTFSATTAFAANQTRFVYNGKEVSASAGAIFKNGYTFLPAKDIFKMAGLHIIEKASNKSITAEVYKKPGYVSIFENKKTARMNGQNINLAIAPFKENGATYVSSKFIEEQLGVKVAYDKAKNTIYVNSNGEGKITSTVKKATTKSSSTQKGTTTTTTTANSKYSLYEKCKYIPDFASVLNIEKAVPDAGVLNLSGTISGNHSYYRGENGRAYEYNDVTIENVQKYVEVLKNLGFKLEGSIVANTGFGKEGVYFSKGSEKGHIYFREQYVQSGSSYIHTSSTVYPAHCFIEIRYK